MNAYKSALSVTSKPWAPWYAIPADNKHYMRMRVAQLVVDAMKSLALEYPTVSKDDKEHFKVLQDELAK